MEHCDLVCFEHSLCATSVCEDSSQIVGVFHYRRFERRGDEVFLSHGWERGEQLVGFARERLRDEELGDRCHEWKIL